MTTTTDKLAEALRALEGALSPLNSGGLYLEDHEAADLTRNARDALAAYDAERAAPVRETAGSHTAEPWAIGFSDGTGPTYITAGDHPALTRAELSIAVVVSGGTDDWGVTHGVRRPEDARRIVACVNACAGLRTEVLERMPPGALHAARRVCVAFERAYGDDLTNDAPINGGDAVDLLGQVATLIRQGAGGAA